MFEYSRKTVTFWIVWYEDLSIYKIRIEHDREVYSVDTPYMTYEDAEHDLNVILDVLCEGGWTVAELPRKEGMPES